MTVHLGDCLDVMRGMPEASVHCVVTSPPYWGLRDYGAPGQLGLEATPQEYVGRMVERFREVRRVLRPDGTCWLNIGDSYASSPPGNRTKGVSDRSTLHGVNGESGRYRDTLNRSVQTKRSTVADGLKPKDLCLIPERLALALQSDGAVDPRAMLQIEGLVAAITASYDSRDEWPTLIQREVERLEAEWSAAHAGGWYIRSRIAWCKRAPMPESVRDRPTSAWEHVWLLTRSADYFYDAEAVREEAEYGRRKWSDVEAVLASATRAGDKRPHHGVRAKSSVTGADPSAGRNMRNFWLLGPEPFAAAHFATFPSEIPRRAIAAGTSEHGCCPECGAPWRRCVERVEAPDLKRPDGWDTGPGGHGSFHRNGREKGITGAATRPETTGWAPGCAHGHEPVPAVVLDPFAGSGTTLAVARRMGRRAVGVELQRDYLPLIQQRVGAGAAPLIEEVIAMPDPAQQLGLEGV